MAPETGNKNSRHVAQPSKSLLQESHRSAIVLNEIFLANHWIASLLEAVPKLVLLATGSKETKSIMEDAKPAVGFIPQREPLPPPTEGKMYFKVELLVGDDEQLVLPFKQEHVCHELAIDYYVAMDGLQTRQASPGRGALYGARVYIDSGDADR